LGGGWLWAGAAVRRPRQQRCEPWRRAPWVRPRCISADDLQKWRLNTADPQGVHRL